MLRVSGIVEDSIVDGPGLRLVIFTQGCPHKCPGCHNPKTHSMEGGSFVPTESILRLLRENPLLDGLTLSGGEPLLQCAELLSLLEGIDRMRESGRSLNVVLYTGYVWEDLPKADKMLSAVLKKVDVLVDGPYRAAERTFSLPYRGSRNQRAIDLKRSRLRGQVVEMDKAPWVQEAPWGQETWRGARLHV